MYISARVIYFVISVIVDLLWSVASSISERDGSIGALVENVCPDLNGMDVRGTSEERNGIINFIILEVAYPP